MTARNDARAVATMAMALIGSLAATAAAQSSGQRVGNPNAPRLMVGTLKNADKKLGPDAAEALRNHISGDVSYRNLTVVPKQDIVNMLNGSGYPENEALSPADANQLAKMLRSDFYLEGSVDKSATGFQATVSLILARDQNMVQPLGTFDGVKLENVADKVSREFQNALKTFEPEKGCRLHAREGKTAEALKEVASGVAAYPKSTWLRYCELAIFLEQKKPGPEIIKVIEEIRAIDPTSRMALREAVTQYAATGNKDKKIEALQALYKADPNNAQLGVQIANELALAGKFDIARPIVEKLVADNPGDGQLVKTYWLILGATNDIKKMLQVGEQMVQIDSSLADQEYFDRMITAYSADSQYQKAAETAARATVKFPTNAGNWVRSGNLQRRIGLTQQSIASAKRALGLDPKTPNARLLIIQGYVDLSQFDSVYTAMHEAVKAGEDVATIADYSTNIGNRLYRAASAAQDKTVELYQKAIPYLSYADSIAKPGQTKVQAEFLIGVSSFYIGALHIQAAQKTKSCELAKRGREAFTDADINVPRGAAISPDAARQMMLQLTEYEGVADKMIKAFCRAETTKKPKS